MKAVLLAGGLGTRMREETEFRPKPMVEVGGRPILWHIMKILAKQGISEFIICAGYKSEYIKNYFYNYGATNLDFTIRLGDQESAVFHGSHDEFDWTVTVADTGDETPTGGRIKQIEKYVGNERFFCTYGDGIADVNISNLLAAHETTGGIATLTATKPTSRFGVVDIDQAGKAREFREKPEGNDWINIGYFIFEPEVFQRVDASKMLEEGLLKDLAKAESLGTHKHEGYWQPMDTVREAQLLNEIWARGDAPWKIW